MLKSFIKYLIYYILITLFFSCASIKVPGGGPIDKIPPFLLANEIIPSSNINIKKNQTIKLFFNERIHPNTTLGSITVEPETDVVIKTNNNLITIKPKDEWPDQFRIFISRKIADYFNNNLAFPIDLLFSRLDVIYNKQIKGTLFNIDTTKIYEVALVGSNGSIFSKTETSINGDYNFSGLKDHPFNIILAIEDKFSDDILSDIRNKRYGISNRTINPINNPIFISDPIYRAKVNNVNLINAQYGKINLSNNTSLNVIFNNKEIKEITKKSKDYLYFDHNFGDSLFISTLVNSHIESYMISKTVLLSDEVLDTLPPLIDIQYAHGDSLLVQFNEPILINKDLEPFYFVNTDSSNIAIDYLYLNPKLLYLDNTNRFKIINANCNGITDLALNPLCDSLLLITNIPKDEHSYSYGQINGDVNYNGDKNLIGQAKKLNTGEITRQRIINNKFNFDKLLKGDYQICIYEDINPITSSYFSGTLEPIKLSAKFSIYNRDIYVRENWSNSITIQLK